MKSLKAISAVLVASLLGTANILQAETVRMPVGTHSDNATYEKPGRGSTKRQVEQRFGTPDSKNGPRGEPPIYFWEYPDFTVYFEADRVLHTVSKRR